MIIAFCLYKYFPFGGLQRDFMRIAKAVAARGCKVRVYTQSWQGEIPDIFDVIIVPVKARSNHGRNAEYQAWVSVDLREHPVDSVVGFNKMPGLDFYYAADVCYAEKVAQEKGLLYRLTSRYKHYSAFERATFEPGGKTKILVLTNKQQDDFVKHYQTESERFYALPPGIYPDRRFDMHPQGSREIYRQKNNIEPDEYLLLQVGSDFSRKGVDRAILALAALPDSLRIKTKLFVVGQDKPKRFQSIAKKNNVEESVFFFSGRNDISELMLAADILVHPAYQEAAGIVLLEAICAGLPILVSGVCGYAHYILDAQCGVVMSEPFNQDDLNKVLTSALTDQNTRDKWAENARMFSITHDIYSLPEQAAKLIVGDLID